MSRVVFFDLDGTITKRDTYVAYLTGYLLRRPARLAASALPLAGAVGLFVAGRRDNTWLKRTFLARILAGRTRAELDAWTTSFVDRIVAHGLRPRALAAIAEHRRAGDHLVLLTASLDVYADAIGHHLGFDTVVATRTMVGPDGRLTGELDGGNCYGSEKLVRARALVAGLEPPVRTIAYSDHHSDLDLLRWVGQAIAVNPTRQLRARAGRGGMTAVQW